MIETKQDELTVRIEKLERKVAKLERAVDMCARQNENK